MGLHGSAYCCRWTWKLPMGLHRSAYCCRFHVGEIFIISTFFPFFAPSNCSTQRLCNCCRDKSLKMHHGSNSSKQSVFTHVRFRCDLCESRLRCVFLISAWNGVHAGVSCRTFERFVTASAAVHIPYKASFFFGKFERDTEYIPRNSYVQTHRGHVLARLFRKYSAPN